MSNNENLKRLCRDCPAEVKLVCHAAFGKYWRDKSANGIGCNAPVDGMAKSWYASGWGTVGHNAKTLQGIFRI